MRVPERGYGGAVAKLSAQVAKYSPGYALERINAMACATLCGWAFSDGGSYGSRLCQQGVLTF